MSKMDAFWMAVAGFTIFIACIIVGACFGYILLHLTMVGYMIFGGLIATFLLMWVGIYLFDKHF